MPALILIFSFLYFLYIFYSYVFPFSEVYLLHLASRDFFLSFLYYYSCMSQGRVRLCRVGLSAAVTPSPFLFSRYDTHHIEVIESYLLLTGRPLASPPKPQQKDPFQG